MRLQMLRANFLGPNDHTDEKMRPFGQLGWLAPRLRPMMGQLVVIVATTPARGSVCPTWKRLGERRRRRQDPCRRAGEMEREGEGAANLQPECCAAGLLT